MNKYIAFYVILLLIIKVKGSSYKNAKPIINCNKVWKERNIQKKILVVKCLAASEIYENTVNLRK